MQKARKIFLSESEMPEAWYNIQADLPEPLDPALHPGTLQPIGPQDLAPIFPLELIKQEELSAEQEGTFGEIVLVPLVNDKATS